MNDLRASFVPLSLFLAAGVLGAACTSEGSGSASSVDASDDADAMAGGPDVTPPADEDEAGPPATRLRVAALSPDTPAFDLCLARHGTGDYQGPLLAQRAQDAGLPADGLAPGLSYPEVSAYLPFDPGQYDVRLVPAGATSCATALVIPTASADAGPTADDDADTEAGVGAATPAPLPDSTNLPALAVGTSTTLLVAGDLSPGGGAGAALRLTAIEDDAAAHGAISLRVVNAQPSAPALDFGFGSFAGEWTPLFTGVAFESAGSKAAPNQGVADANGYLAIAPYTGTISARLSTGATGDAAVANSVSLDVVGSVATLVAIGGTTGDRSHAPALLLCIDDSPSGGALADCSVLP
jgi:hypothetical protein